MLGSLATAFSPYLLVEQPLLLVAGSAVNRHVLLAAAVVEPFPLWVVASLRRLLALLVTYGLGYVYGAKALSWAEERFPWAHRLAVWLQRLLDRLGVGLLVPFNGFTLVALAGVGRMRLRPFLVAVTLGNLLYVAALVWLGDLAAEWSRLLIDWIAAHLLESTLACVLVVVVQQVAARRRARKEPEDRA